MTHAVRSTLRLWFGLADPVDRRSYAVSGFSLMAAKYALDAAAVWLVAGRSWTPLDYLNPFATLRQQSLEGAWLLVALGLWSLPFLWIALSMTLRRALDAGRSPWLNLLVLLPGVNYLLMLALCAARSRERAPARRAFDVGAEAHLRSALLGVAAGVAAGVVIAVAMVIVSVELWRSYGATLFFLTPTVIGAIGGYLHNRPQLRPLGETIIVATLTVLLAGGALLLFALEGVMCLLMVFPLAHAAALLGALLGRAIAGSGAGTPAQALLVAAALPLLAGFDALPSESPLYEVASSVEVDAPPARVWQHVIAFEQLPPPHELVFRTGIAYPVRARIEGRGVGALRYCEFSTGAFVEPITRWDEPHALGFDVASQPAPMLEQSPYGPIVTPHLDGYFRSVRGEFRLVALPGGRTRLEGSTWYALDLQPRSYFRVWSDALVSRIHLRVLEHVKRLAESERPTSP